MEPRLNQVGGLTILKESDNKNVIHVELSKGKLETKDGDTLAKFDTGRSIADQISDHLRQSTTYSQEEKKK